MAQDRLRIEPVGPEAAALVHRLMIEAFAEYRDWLQPPTGALSETVDDVAHGIANGGAAVAWLGEVPAGAVRFTIEPDHLYVGRLAVPPAHRGRGVARALMAHADERVATLGLPAVRVEVRTALPGNIALFTRLGFVHKETRSHPRLPSATFELLEKPVGKLRWQMKTEQIHSVIAQLPRCNDQTDWKEIPNNGLYFFYERGEIACVGGKEVDRIMRVGTHRATGRLPKRVRSHFAGNRRGSVFRRHLGGALLSRQAPNDPKIREWIKQRGELMPASERAVDATLRDSFSFRCVQVDDRDERLSLERGLIAQLAQHAIGLPSRTWLGRHAVHPIIRETGLWNTQHVNATPITEEEIERLACLVQSTLERNI